MNTCLTSAFKNLTPKKQPLSLPKKASYYLDHRRHFFVIEPFCTTQQDGKTTDVQLSQRQESLSIMGDTIVGPVYHSAIVLGGSRGALHHWDPIKPRDASFPDSECKFVQSGPGIPCRKWLYWTYFRNIKQIRWSKLHRKRFV